MPEGYSVKAILSAEDKNFSSTMSKAASGLDSLTGKLSKGVGFGVMMAAGQQAFSAVTGGIKNMVSGIVEAGSSFEAASSQIAATMGKPKSEIQNIIDEAERLGATTAFTATEAAEGFNVLAQSGLDAEQQIATLPNVLNLAAAGAYDMDTAAGQVTGTIKGFKSETNGMADSFINGVSSSQYYADMLAKGATLANTDVNMLGNALSDAAASADSYGQSSKSTTVALLRLAEQNVTGAEAATALNRAMADLYTPTSEAAAAMAKLGVSAYDETGKARDLNDVIGDLDTALSGMSEEQQNAYKSTIFSTFGLKAFDKMVKTDTDKLNEWSDALDGAGGAAEEMAKTQLDNLKGDITLFGSALEGLQNAIYGHFTGPLRLAVKIGTSGLTSLTDKVKALGDVFDNAFDFDSLFETLENEGVGATINQIIGSIDKLPDSFKQIAAVGGASLATMMAGSFFQSETWAGLKGGIGSVADLATSIPGKLGKSAGSMLGTAKNVGGVMAKIVPSGIKGKVANLNAGFRQFVLTGNAVRKGMTNMFLSGTKVGQLFARIGPVVSQSTGMIGNGILTVGGQMASGLQTMMGLAMKALLPAALIATALAGLGLLYQKFGDQIDQMLNMAQTKGPEIISGLINGITSQLPTLIASGAQLVSGLMDTVTANAPTVIQGGVQLVQSLVQGLASSLPTLIPSAINMVMTLVSGILSAIPSLISTGMQLLLALAQGVVSNLPLMIAQGMAAIQSFGQSIQSNLPTILSTAAQIVMTLVTGIVQNLPTIIQNGITLITSLVQGIIENLPMILGTAAQVIGTLAEGLVQAIPTLIAAIPQLVMALINTIMETDWAAVGTDILNAIGEGLFSGFTSIGDKIGGLFSGLTGWGEGGQQGGNQLTTAAASEVQATAGVLNTAASTAGSEAGMSMGTGFETGITTGFSSAQGIVTTTTDQIVVSMQSASAGAASAGTQTGQSYSTAISSGMQGAQTAVQNAGNQIGATLTATTAKGKSAGTMLGTGYSVAVKAGMTKAQTAVKTATTQMGAALTAFTSKARSSGQQAGNGFSSGLQNGMRRSVSSTSSIVSRVTSIMRSGYGRAYSAGSYMGQGLVNGLNSKYGAVAAAASRLAAKAMEAMAAAAKIGSPSKITTQYGRWIGDGLINGTEDRIGKVRHAMQRLADMSSFDNLQPAYAGAFGGSLSEDYNYMMESSYEIHVHTDLNGREVAHEIVDDLTDIQDKKTRNNNRRKGIK